MDSPLVLTNHSKVLQDTLIVFAQAYMEYSDLMVSCAYAKLGVYSFANIKNDKPTRTMYASKLSKTLDSYIWKTLGHVSTSLKTSFLYTYYSYGFQHLSKMNDQCLSKSFKSFKQDFAIFLKTHSVFISYCDIELRELFMFTDGSQSLTRSQYLDLYECAQKELDVLYIKYGKMSKTFKSILDDISFLMDVRIFKDERLCIVMDNKSFASIARTASKDVFELPKIVTSLQKGGINDLFDGLKKTYAMLIPFYVFQDVKSLITMQGVAKEGDIPLSKYFPDVVFANANIFKDALLVLKDRLVLKDLLHLNFLHTVYNSVDDYEFFANYTPEKLGFYVICHIKNMIRILKRNVEVFVLADMLSIGIFDMLGQDWQSKSSTVERILQQAKYDVDCLSRCFQEYPIMSSLIGDTMSSFHTSMKKVDRYFKWLQSLEDVGVDNQIMDLIFGDVTDNDGNAVVCAICLDSAHERREGWFNLPCKHMFHSKCIRPWLQV
jgi:hypothetical protein